MNTNAVAIHGNFTEDGKPFLSCDPHVGLSAPPYFSLVEMSFGDESVQGTISPG
jgi:acyl-homoserine lactone acylase PvdQ